MKTCLHQWRTLIRISMFQALGQWERSEKRNGVERGLGSWSNWRATNSLWDSCSRLSAYKLRTSLATDKLHSIIRCLSRMEVILENKRTLFNILLGMHFSLKILAGTHEIHLLKKKPIGNRETLKLFPFCLGNSCLMQLNGRMDFCFDSHGENMRNRKRREANNLVLLGQVVVFFDGPFNLVPWVFSLAWGRGGE